MAGYDDIEIDPGDLQGQQRGGGQPPPQRPRPPAAPGGGPWAGGQSGAGAQYGSQSSPGGYGPPPGGGYGPPPPPQGQTYGGGGYGNTGGGGPWQQGGGGFGGPPPPRAPARPAPRPRRDPGEPPSGFFGRLFDFSFSSFLTVTLAKVLYGIVLVFGALTAVVIIIALASQKPAYLVIGIIVAPLMFLVIAIYGRIVAEGMIVLFKIAENTDRTSRNTARARNGDDEGPGRGTI